MHLHLLFFLNQLHQRRLPRFIPLCITAAVFHAPTVMNEKFPCTSVYSYVNAPTDLQTNVLDIQKREKERKCKITGTEPVQDGAAPWPPFWN